MKVKGEKLSELEFQTRVMHQIIEKYGAPKETKLQNHQKPTIASLLDVTFPPYALIKEEKKARRCIVYSKSNKKERRKKMSYYECKTCNVGLCVNPCFQVYHIQRNF